MREFILEDLVRPNIRAFKPYSTARNEFSCPEKIDDYVFLDANENSLGSVLQGSGGNNRYPDPVQRRLKSKLAQLKGVLPENIFFGNGSDEAIDLLLRIFCQPGQDRIVVLQPTYGMYEVAAHIQDVAVCKVLLTSDFQLDSQRVLQAIDPQTKLVFICSPNNPSGNCFERTAIERILTNFNGVVVLDQAYIDYSSENSFLDVLNNFPNLVILETFSKAWGLANLRVGMAFASPAIIALLNKIKAPYNLSGLVQDALYAALDNVALKENMARETIKERHELEEILSSFSFVLKVFPSDANFLFVAAQQSKKIYYWLLANRIVVRYRSQIELCQDYLRITVGTAGENKRLVSALQEYEAQAGEVRI